MKYFSYVTYLDQNLFNEKYPEDRLYKFAYLTEYKLIPTTEGSRLDYFKEGFVEGILYDINEDTLLEMEKVYQSKPTKLNVVADSGEIYSALVFLEARGENHDTILSKYYWKYGFDKSNLSLYSLLRKYLSDGILKRVSLKP
jgi:hypothetical protein